MNVLIAPSAALEDLRRHGRAWFPIVAKLLVVVGFWTWYFRAVDLEWFKEAVLFAGGDIPPEARAAVDELFTARVLTVATLASELVILAVILLGLSGYLWAVGRDGRGARPALRQWVALVAWASVPTFLVPLAMAALVLLRGGQILTTDLDPTSLNNLLLHVEPTSAWATWATSLSVVHLWSLAIVALGFRRWTGRSWAASGAIVALPLVVGFGLWALAIAR